MQIAQDTFVRLNYELKDDSGAVLDTTENRSSFAYVHGTRAVLPAIEQALEGKAAGDELIVRIPSEEAYGERNESLVFTTSKTNFDDGDDIKPGIRVRVRTSSGEQILMITEIEDKKVTLDGNHPLAGVNLNFQISVLEVRDSTEKELDQATSSPEPEDSDDAKDDPEKES